MRYGIQFGISIFDTEWRRRASERREKLQFKFSFPFFLSGLQVVISAILKAIGPLVNIALLLLFAIIIFAIVGLEFYAGALNSTCYDITDLSECGAKRNLILYFLLICVIFPESALTIVGAQFLSFLLSHVMFGTCLFSALHTL